MKKLSHSQKFKLKFKKLQEKQAKSGSAVPKLTKPQKGKKHKKLKKVDNVYANEWGASKIGKNPQKDIRFNRKPKNIDDQEMPRSVLQLSIPPKVNKKQHKNKNKFNEDFQQPKEKGMDRPVKPVPNIEQRPNESENTFFNRLNDMCKTAIAEAQLDAKYGLGLEITEDGTLVQKTKTKRKEKQIQKAKERKEKIKLKKLEKSGKMHLDFSDLRDDVEFGEVVHQPPALTARPRKTNPLPSVKKLLLHDILQQTNSTKDGVTKKREIGKTVKRKHLSIAEKRKMDSEQERAIALYREMKAKKQKRDFVT